MSDRISGSEPRYHALDSVRAAAMLLGVLYHAMIFRMIFSGKAAFLNPKLGQRWTFEWMHSFRMPLFFLISGFFGAMMLEKYGTRRFLEKRWSRIGIPMFVGLLTLSPISTLTFFLLFADATETRSSAETKSTASANKQDGSPSKTPAAKKTSPKETASETPTAAKTEKTPKTKEAPSASKTEDDPLEPKKGPPTIAERLIGQVAGLFALSYFWFMWYLLLFITITPFLIRVMGALFRSMTPSRIEETGLGIIRVGLAPVILGLVSTPALILAPMPFGWSLGTPSAAGLPFPDFALRLDPEFGFYLLYFLTGWWLYHARQGLSILARAWLPNLALGTIAFTLATETSAAYFSKSGTPYYQWIRAGTYLSYCLGSAFTAFGFLGLFERYFNRPSRLGRYLADTAFWVYVTHLPLVSLFLYLFRPLHLPWVLDGFCTSTLAAGSATFLYQKIVRHTFLARLYGPADAHKKPLLEPEIPGLLET